MMRHRIFTALILLWLGWQIAHPINLVEADLGRHIKNGELLLQGTTDILYKNFYSYTYPDYSFINHHWFFGVLCFLVWHCFGFTGLSSGYIVLQLLTFFIFLVLSKRYSSFLLSCAIGLLSIPLVALRYEIRPEGISMLLCGLCWLMLVKFQDQKLPGRYLKTGLAAVQVVWVNTHIFFIMGPIMVGLCWLQSRLDHQKEQARDLKLAFWLTAGACLINPSGLWGALTPFNIFKGLGLALIENQSIIVMFKEFPHDRFFYYFVGTIVFMAIPWIILLRKEGVRRHVFLAGLMVLVSLCALKAVRMIGVYAYCWIPLSAYAWGKYLASWSKTSAEKAVRIFLIAGILSSAFINFNWVQQPALGLASGTNAPAEFLKSNHIQGPIFNNYTVGGYLIFHLSPSYKFFTDNRQEAFPPEFFKMTLEPMIFNEPAWLQKDTQYHFNAIVFARYPFEVRFLSRRAHDPAWALVFSDDQVAIFLRRNLQNAPVIQKYEIKRPS
ncbi:MAG: hypothetical protein HQL17_06600 [Candidatus Omnitrophica bacterium]|nr:hypothetical protein [Candidatus Omnitrophota bacterium]